jgi:ribosomal protein S12 methylthiotransferase accessory factor
VIFEGLTYADYAASSGDSRLKLIGSFIEFLERKLGVKVMYDRHRIPMGRLDLREPFRLANLLQQHGVIESFQKVEPIPDEPAFCFWSAICSDAKSHIVAGASVDDESAALYATLAEGLERYLWFTQKDYFVKPMRASTSDMEKRGRSFISPERFVSFTQEQRDASAELKLDPQAKYVWIQSTSLIHNKKIFVPAQIASAAIRPLAEISKEPLIRMQTTNGLATWSTREGALLRGALEIIERDAYMIMWLNQLTMPRISLAALRGKSSSLDSLLERCERYRLKVHAIHMTTDAPTHAVCVVLEDESGHIPKFAFGLKAHRSLTTTVEKALIEGLRAYRSCYKYFASGNTWDPSTPLDTIGHRERMYYWGSGENASRLEFLIRGKEIKQESAVWENDTEEQHLKRLLDWCRSKNYECVSVSLGTSAKNPTPWHVEMVIMPDLQPTYLLEWRQMFTGERLRAVPLEFGYVPRETPFIDAPHPFC